MAPFLGSALVMQHSNPAFRCRLRCPCGNPQKPFSLVTVVLPSGSQICDFVFPGQENSERSTACCKHRLSA